ncbi:hypothetical protein Glove_375g63 [Diversispora epigaea]|uniref:Uncharacterized protein n=1 Tax=Diversispora epigaea TaxID=1348612 RepID=A0A397H961_9GLOM|nr:hypothetical protein Glove_375g63 [Diversispora epigaea]
MSWPFAILTIGKSSTGKKGESRYIRCDDLIVCEYHPDEPKWKWTFVRYMYASDPRAPYYENIKFNLCVAPESIQNRIIPFFTHGCHRNLHNTKISSCPSNYSGEYFTLQIELRQKKRIKNELTDNVKRLTK